MADMNLKIPALELLVKYTASGIGAVAGPMLAPWKARREAAAKLTEAEAEAGSLKLIAAAQADARRSLVPPDEAGRGVLDISKEGIEQRIEFQEKKRQANIASVVREAADDLQDKEAPDQEPDPDWTARFFDCVQDVTSEDMQKLWSQVLSGEVESPGRTSLRTLDILKNMTRRDALMFHNVCGYVIQDFILKSDEIQMKYPALSLANLLSLQDAGLINADPMLANIFNLNVHPHSSLILYQNLLLRISAKDKIEFRVPSYPLTSAGKELHQFAKCEPCMDYLTSFSRLLRGKGCELSFSDILEKYPDGFVLHADQFVPIEPEDQPSAAAAP